MNQEQTNYSQPNQIPLPYGPSRSQMREQMRHERRMAKQAARLERHALRAQQPRQDWSFEVRLGEKVYTFTWRWHGPVFQTQDESAGTAPDPEAASAADEPEAVS